MDRGTSAVVALCCLSDAAFLANVRVAACRAFSVNYCLHPAGLSAHPPVLIYCEA